MPRRLSFSRTFGWQAVKRIVINKKRKDVTKFFSDLKYGYEGGYTAAKQQEKLWGKILTGVRNRMPFRTSPLPTNKSTGIVGLSAGSSYDKRQNCRYWNIQTFFLKNKKVIHSSFSINKYGLTKALQLAIEERFIQMYGKDELKKILNNKFGSSKTFFQDRLMHMRKYLLDKGLKSIPL